jgi:hypothetical protein
MSSAPSGYSPADANKYGETGAVPRFSSYGLWGRMRKLGAIVRYQPLVHDSECRIDCASLGAIVKDGVHLETPGRVGYGGC